MVKINTTYIFLNYIFLIYIYIYNTFFWNTIFFGWRLMKLRPVIRDQFNQGRYSAMDVICWIQHSNQQTALDVELRIFTVLRTHVKINISLGVTISFSHKLHNREHWGKHWGSHQCLFCTESVAVILNTLLLKRIKLAGYLMTIALIWPSRLTGR